MTDTTTGRCYCGACTITLTGPARVSGLCHCRSCRSWHAAPMTAWCTWKTPHVVISGAVIEATASPQSTRVSCARCGGHMANHKPEHGVSVVYPNTLDGFRFTPGLHVFYAERVMDIADGLTKFADLPAEMGGTGRISPEPSRTGYLSNLR